MRRWLPDGGCPARVLDGCGGSGAAAVQALLQGHEVWVCERHALGLLAARARARAVQMDPQRLEKLRLAFLQFGGRLAVRPPIPARRGLWHSQLRRQALAVEDFILGWEEDDPEAADLLRLALAAALTEAAERPQVLRKIRPSRRARRRQSGLIGLLAARLGRMVEDLRRLRPKVGERPSMTAYFFNEAFPAPQLPARAFDLILLSLPDGSLCGSAFAGSLDLPLLDADLLPPGARWKPRPEFPRLEHGVLQGLRRCLRKDGRAALWMPWAAEQGGWPWPASRSGLEAAGLRDESSGIPGLLVLKTV
ncbi:MAG TPA: hypothetical protein VLU25_17705 [Acidobacteriota bacterium]|nr:hypothetical protein [Acidobacteriota bacterium]